MLKPGVAYIYSLSGTTLGKKLILNPANKLKKLLTYSGYKMLTFNKKCISYVMSINCIKIKYPPDKISGIADIPVAVAAAVEAEEKACYCAAYSSGL